MALPRQHQTSKAVVCLTCAGHHAQKARQESSSLQPKLRALSRSAAHLKVRVGPPPCLPNVHGRQVWHTPPGGQLLLVARCKQLCRQVGLGAGHPVTYGQYRKDLKVGTIQKGQVGGLRAGRPAACRGGVLSMCKEGQGTVGAAIRELKLGVTCSSAIQG